jgi:microcystin-dependent protein
MADSASTEEQRSNLSISGELTRAVLYNNTTDAAQALISANKSFIPTGGVSQYASNAIPKGFLLCDGSAYERTRYALLFAVISTTYNTGGETATQFRVPDLRGRSVFGRDDMGGSAQNRITAAGSSIVGTTLGVSGGNQGLQSHSHTVYDPGHAHNYYYARSLAGYGLPYPSYGNTVYINDYGKAMSYEGTGISLASSGAGVTGSQNMPPTLILNYIIKT